MSRYLLSTHSVEGNARPPMSDEEMQLLNPDLIEEHAVEGVELHVARA